MKKFLIISVLMGLFFIGIQHVDAAPRTRNSFTSGATSTLVSKRAIDIVRICFISTANGGSFTIYDTTGENGTGTVVMEGKEATSGNSKVLDFSNDPIHVDNGCYLAVVSGQVSIEYR